MKTTHSIYLTQTASAWGSETRDEVLRQELERLDPTSLPLQAGLSRGSHVTAEPFRIMIIDTTQTADRYIATVGVFYESVIAGCSCSDDPTPVDSEPEYCALRLEIHPVTGETSITLLD